MHNSLFWISLLSQDSMQTQSGVCIAQRTLKKSNLGNKLLANSPMYWRMSQVVNHYRTFPWDWLCCDNSLTTISITTHRDSSGVGTDGSGRYHWTVIEWASQVMLVKKKDNSLDCWLSKVEWSHSASDRRIGAVLSQTDADGLEHPVAYFSWKLLPREVCNNWKGVFGYKAGSGSIQYISTWLTLYNPDWSQVTWVDGQD